MLNYRVFNNIDSLITWVEKITNDGKLENWNVVVSGKTSNQNSIWKLPQGNVNKISRTRKRQQNEFDNIINIGVLRDPKDVIADIDLDGKSADIVEKVTRKFQSKYAKELRNFTGLDTTPQLLIYMIDKNSKAREGSQTRYDLNAVEDIVGICLNIPGGKKGANYAERVSIHIDNNPFDDEGDLEGTNED